MRCPTKSCDSFVGLASAPYMDWGQSDLHHRLVLPWRGFWRPTWSRRELLNGHWFRFEIFLLGLLFVAVPYFASNNIAAHYLGTVWDPEIWLDREIPVINWTIIPYATLYLFYPATLVVSPRHDRGRAELVLAMQTLILATLFCSFFFLVFPAEIDLRDQLDLDSLTDLESSLFGFVHFSDNPWNAWPSLHIVHSYILARLMTHWLSREHEGKPLARAFVVLLWVEYALLCISILTTKQHYLFDLVTGLAVGMVAWRLFQPALELVASDGGGQVAEDAGWT